MYEGEALWDTLPLELLEGDIKLLAEKIGVPDAVLVEEPLEDSQKDPDEVSEAEEDTLCVTAVENEGLTLSEGDTLCDAKSDAEPLGEPESDTLDEPLWETDEVPQLVKVPPEGDATELTEGEGEVE